MTMPDRDTDKIRQLAVKRHDLDADWFQSTYESKDGGFDIFLVGRAFVLDELSRVLEGLPKGARILDVGSGTGHLAASLTKQGFRVTGVEPAASMIALARKNFPEIEFKEGISSKLPIGDDEFDLIISFEVLRYLNEEENRATYREYRRVLKPGGKIFVTHVNRYASDFYYFFYYAKGLAYRAANATYHYCYFTTPGRQEDLLVEAGFKNPATIGRLSGTIRIAAKLGKTAGAVANRLVNRVAKDQRFLHDPLKALAGHLVVIAEK
jgi:ubiquinone/menaquinone biosynthesis C-methylase UbiE